MTLDEFCESVTADWPTERLLKRIKPEDRLQGLTPEERARLRALLDQDES